jgi:hypothetical protein
MSTNPDTNASNQDGNTTSDTTSGAGDKFEPITSQDELNKAIGARLERERAKFADYEAIKARAAKLDELEAANKTELEKAQEAAAAAAAERDAARAEGLRFRVAAKHGISTEDADLFLTGQDEQTLEAQAKRLADRETDRKKNGARAPREGTGSTTQSSDLRDFARDLFTPTS